MDALLFRMRVAVLWLAVALAMSASLLLHLFMPGAVEEMAAGEIEGETLTDGLSWFFGAVGTFPLVMAAVALLVSDRVNRSVNLIAGSVFGLFGVFAVVTHALAGDFNVHVASVALAGAGAFLIAGLSLAGLRRPKSQPTAPPSESQPSRSEEALSV